MGKADSGKRCDFQLRQNLFWRELFDIFPDPVAFLDAQYRIVRANQALAGALKCCAEELVGRHCYEVFHGGTCPIQKCPHTHLLVDHCTHSVELDIDVLGGVHWVSVTPVFDSTGGLVGALHMARNVAHYKDLEKELCLARDTLAIRAEAQARALKKHVRFEQLLVSFALDFGQARQKHDLQKLIQEGMCEIAKAGDFDRCVFWEVKNAQTASVFARYDRPCVELEPQPDLAAKEQAAWLYAAADRMGAVERLADGHMRCVTVLLSADHEETGFALQVDYWPGSKKNTLPVTPARMSLFCRVFSNALWRHADMVAIQRMRDEMIRMEHVSRLGQLAGVLAHELNQPLSAILCNAQAAGHWLAQTPSNVGETRSALMDIVENARHASDVIRQTRSMFTQKMPAVQKVSIASCVKNALSLVNNRAALSGVVVEWTVDTSLPPVLGDRVQLRQVLVNLLNNAIDAVCKRPKKLRHIVVSSVADASAHTLQLRVKDSGVGFPTGKENTIFEPFYTTKPNGMGMGLPICRQIVENFGGNIRAHRDTDGGTVFCVTLPLASGPRKSARKK